MQIQLEVDRDLTILFRLLTEDADFIGDDVVQQRAMRRRLVWRQRTLSGRKVGHAHAFSCQVNLAQVIQRVCRQISSTAQTIHRPAMVLISCFTSWITSAL